MSAKSTENISHNRLKRKFSFVKQFEAFFYISNTRNTNTATFTTTVVEADFDQLVGVKILKGKKKGKLRISEVILGASDEIKINFIAGFFDADGCIYVKRKNISIVQADRKILESLSYLLNSLNISTRKIYKTKKELGVTYDLSISWKSVKDFLEMTPFKDLKRIENKKMILAEYYS